jgi:hypothetical protein
MKKLLFLILLTPFTYAESNQERHSDVCYIKTTNDNTVISEQLEKQGCERGNHLFIEDKSSILNRDDMVLYATFYCDFDSVVLVTDNRLSCIYSDNKKYKVNPYS